jgi:hypothetical protein
MHPTIRDRSLLDAIVRVQQHPNHYDTFAEALRLVPSVQWGLFKRHWQNLGEDPHNALLDIRTALWIAMRTFPLQNASFWIARILYRRALNALRTLFDFHWKKKHTEELREESLQYTPEAPTPPLREVLSTAVDTGVIAPLSGHILQLRACGLNDQQIGTQLHLKRSSVQHKRVSAIHSLQQYTSMIGGVACL